MNMKLVTVLGCAIFFCLSLCAGKKSSLQRGGTERDRAGRIFKRMLLDDASITTLDADNYLHSDAKVKCFLKSERISPEVFPYPQEGIKWNQSRDRKTIIIDEYKTIIFGKFNPVNTQKTSKIKISKRYKIWIAWIYVSGAYVGNYIWCEKGYPREPITRNQEVQVSQEDSSPDFDPVLGCEIPPVELKDLEFLKKFMSSEIRDTLWPAQ